MARQGWEACFSHNTWQLLISNTAHCTHSFKNAADLKAHQPRGAVSVSSYPGRFFSFTLQHTALSQIKQCCQVRFNRCFMEWKKGKANFFSVFRWWTSQAVVFVFAEWWKADGMLLSSTWVDAVYAEGHWNSPRLLNNVDHSQVHRVKSSHPVLTF